MLDIITFEVQDKIYGFNTRVSFLQLGILYQDEDSNNLGIKNGIIGNLDHQNFSLFLLGSERFMGKKFKIHQDYENQIKKIQKSNPENSNIPEELIQYYNLKNDTEKQNIESSKRNKFYDVYLPFGTKRSLKKSNYFLKKKEEFAPLTFYTDLKIQVGIYYGITMGINFGEILDFTLGLLNLDIMNDDR